MAIDTPIRIQWRWNALPVSPLTSWCLTHLRWNEACLSQHGSLDKSNIWSGVYCLLWILYKWKAEQMFKDYSSLFSRVWLSVRCAMFRFPPHTSLHLKMGYFPYSWRRSLLAWAVFLWAVLPVFTHHATGPEVAGLASFHWKARISSGKILNTSLLVSHSTRARSCRPSVRLGISNRTQTLWIHWELSLCTACEVGTSLRALV